MIRILLAEDDEIIRITVRDRLERNRWQVDAVSNGKEAINKLKEKRYHVVISDIRMPELDGWEVLGYSRKFCPGTGILLMTGDGGNNRHDSASLEQDPEDFILKPFDLDELNSKVKRILDSQGRG